MMNITDTSTPFISRFTSERAPATPTAVSMPTVHGSGAGAVGTTTTTQASASSVVVATYATTRGDSRTGCSFGRGRQRA
ncbi:hypothetical protein GCM10025868_38030 [Angustibacter aerolatus]|uniref:Uncharacterized protein n=1 Tax=Angustibacter aerolatus TaxID=1162965 RepID=A0ABQ6JKN6_9ACTN|nr:hypothetical protein GCM10025868_38030 [Angustibacter aerolatus]